MKTNGKKYSILELRRARNLTQRQVAEDFGVSLNTYRHWEKDISEVGVYKACALAKYYDVNIGQLLFCTET